MVKYAGNFLSNAYVELEGDIGVQNLSIFTGAKNGFQVSLLIYLPVWQCCLGVCFYK